MVHPCPGSKGVAKCREHGKGTDSRKKDHSVEIRIIIIIYIFKYNYFYLLWDLLRCFAKEETNNKNKNAATLWRVKTFT